MTTITPGEHAVHERLAALGIAFERYEHPPVATAAEADEHWAGIDATHCKNLFLRNQRGDRHYLVIIVHTKRADLRAVAAQIGDGKTQLCVARTADDAPRRHAGVGVAGLD